MRRLFIRFYVGVLFILFVAWMTHGFVFRERTTEENIQVVEEALGGGVRLACAELEALPRDERASELHRLQSRFDYPVTIIPENQIPSYARDRLAAGEDVVLIGREDGGYMLGPLSGSDEALQFGPLPTFVGPSQTEQMTGLAMVLVLAAGAIALLLRPVARQLRRVERTATAIAGGDLTARVDERRVSSARTLARAFNNMAGRTEAMLRTQRELLQAVSHELRTPLSRIHFAIDLLREAEDDQARYERLNSLEHASQELDELMGELLRYVRAETSEIQLQLDSIELKYVVQELFDKQSLIHPDIRFEYRSAAGQEPTIIQADRLSLERALGNLIGNAARFAEGKVVVGASNTTDGTVIDVDDDGRGIPVAERKRVFEPFVRLDDSGRGAGLGLALVRRLVDHHGGTAEALDNPAGGCRIRTLWPAASTGDRPRPRKRRDRAVAPAPVEAS